MPKEKITISITLEYDREQNEDKPARIFLYQFLNQLNREIPILEIEYKNKKKDLKNSNIKDIALRKVDSIDDQDLPKPPEWLKDKTVLTHLKKIT